MNEQQKKYLNCLNEVYELTKDDFVQLNITKILTKHKVTKILSKLIIDNFLYKEGTSRNNVSYKWKTIRPNIKMVDKCLVELFKLNRRNALKNKEILSISDSKPRLDFINYLKSNLSDDYYYKSLYPFSKEHKVSVKFTEFLLINDYILKRRAIGTRGNQYKWNQEKDFEELKKLILESDQNYKGSVQPLQPKAEKVITKKDMPKPSNIDQIKVYEDIIRMISNDLDAKDKKIEELEKMLSLSKKKTKQKSTSIFWGLIKITK